MSGEATAPSLLLTAPEDLNVVAWKTVHAVDKKLICGNGIGRENVEDWSPISNNFDPNERFIVPIDYCVHRNKCRGREGGGEISRKRKFLFCPSCF